MAHMIENTGAADVRFCDGELNEVNFALSKIEVKGGSLPKFVLDLSDVEAPPRK